MIPTSSTSGTNCTQQPMPRTHSSIGSSSSNNNSTSNGQSHPLQRFQNHRMTGTGSNHRTMMTSSNTSTPSLSSSSHSIHSTSSGRYVRRITTRPNWGWFGTTLLFHNTSNGNAVDNDKYRLPSHHRRYKQSTSILLLLIGLVFVAMCSLLLAWNMYFNSYSNSLDFTSIIPRGNVTTIQDLQPQPRILPEADSTSQIHPIHDLAAKSSYKGKLTGIRANILTSGNGNITAPGVNDEPQPASLTSRPIEWRNDENVVHVIQTRFMQTQPQLVELGQARLRLFTAVTVPSMRYQTQQQFLWIIRTDPQLHSSILQPLMETISTLPNAILVASNRNPEGFRDSSCISDITMETLLVGSMEYLQSYYREGQTHTVLETRCDADDAIAIDFVELIQKSATSGLYPLRDDWIVYCADNHMEWQYDNPWANEIDDRSSINDTSNSDTKVENPSGNNLEKERGALLVLRSGHCVTPGLTWGYSINATRRDIPVSQHNKIQKSVKPCGTRWHDTPPLQTKCLLKLGDDFPLALRARTPTSAGMDHVFVANQTENTFPMEHLQQSKARTLQIELWNVLFLLFGVNGEDLYQVRKYVSEHFVAIARDALAGQCTKGHSCKHSSKVLLQNLINAAGRHDSINEITPETVDASKNDKRNNR